jgi:hypothetical protein
MKVKGIQEGQRKQNRNGRDDVGGLGKKNYKG